MLEVVVPGVCLAMVALNWHWHRRYALQLLGDDASDDKLTRMGNMIGLISVVGVARRYGRSWLPTAVGVGWVLLGGLVVILSMR